MTRCVAGDARLHLAVADLDADDVRRAALQQHVGEAAGALADVEAGHAGDVDAAVRDRGVELEAAARDEADLGIVGHLERRVIGKRLAGFPGHHPRAAAAPAKGALRNQPGRSGARGRDAALDGQDVGARHSSELGWRIAALPSL